MMHYVTCSLKIPALSQCGSDIKKWVLEGIGREGGPGPQPLPPTFDEELPSSTHPPSPRYWTNSKQIRWPENCSWERKATAEGSLGECPGQATSNCQWPVGKDWWSREAWERHILTQRTSNLCKAGVLKFITGLLAPYFTPARCVCISVYIYVHNICTDVYLYTYTSRNTFI